MCSALQGLNIWLVAAAAQVSGLTARQHKCLGWSSVDGFTLCSCVDAEHMQNRNQKKEIKDRNMQETCRRNPGQAAGKIHLAVIE